MANTYDTSAFPLGSKDPRVLYNNAENEDLFVNDVVNESFVDRPPFRRNRYTLFGMEQAFKRALANIGFESTYLTYAAGVVIQRPTQLVVRGGVYYRVTDPTNVPLTLTGDWAVDSLKLTDVGDAALRSALAALSGAGLSGFSESQAYAANTVGAQLKYLNAPGIDKEQRTFSDADLIPNLGDTKTLDAAIRSGTVRIAVAGDSITQGDADSLYDNSSFAKIMRRLREENPTVTFVFGNFSIAGLGIPSFSNPNYKGMAPPADPFIGFYRPPGDQLTCQWPGGSVVGKSWADHVRDFSPDLVITAFGANDIAWGSLTLEQYNKTAIDYMLTWTKKPSIAWGAAAVPSEISAYIVPVQNAANVARGVARERGLTLLDFNRIHNVRRYGFDVDNPFYIRDDAFAGFPTGWTLDPGTTLAPSVTVPGALEGNGTAIRNLTSQDCNILASFAATSWAATTVAIYYRDLGTNDGTGPQRYSCFCSGTALSLYWAGTLIGVYVLPAAPPDGTAVTIRVEVRGARHRVFLGGIERINVWHYGNVLPGKHGVGIVGGFGSVYGFEAHLANNYPVGRPQLNDVDIYGINDFGTNPSSLGGNGNNHFTMLGNTVIMAGGYFPLMHHIRQVIPKLSSVIAPVVTNGTQVFDVAGTTLQTRIDGNLAGAATYVLATSTGAVANKQDSVLVNVLTARNVVVEVFHSPGNLFLTTTIAFGVGLWQVNASAQFTKGSAGAYANTMTVTAIRVT